MKITIEGFTIDGNKELRRARLFLAILHFTLKNIFPRHGGDVTISWQKSTVMNTNLKKKHTLDRVFIDELDACDVIAEIKL